MKKEEKTIKCECDDIGKVLPENVYRYSAEEKTGMNHQPNECQGTNQIKKYKRGNKKLWLCSCCNLSTDLKL